MIAINKTHYFNITQKVVDNKEEPETVKMYETFALGLLKREGATLTIDPDIEISEVSGFFRMLHETMRLNADVAQMPPAIQEVLKMIHDLKKDHLQEKPDLPGLLKGIMQTMEQLKGACQCEKCRGKAS